MPVLELDSSTRSALRSAAHPLRPVVLIGDKGLTPAVLQEIDRALGAHGLIKVRIAGDDRAERVAIQAQVAEALSCAPVHHLGKVLVFYRPKADGSPLAAVAGAPAKAKAPAKPAEAVFVPKKLAAEGRTEVPARRRAVARPAKPEGTLSPRERYLGSSERTPRPSLHAKRAAAPKRRGGSSTGSAFSLSARRRRP